MCGFCAGLAGHPHWTEAQREGDAAEVDFAAGNDTCLLLNFADRGILFGLADLAFAPDLGWLRPPLTLLVAALIIASAAAYLIDLDSCTTRCNKSAIDRRPT